MYGIFKGLKVQGVWKILPFHGLAKMAIFPKMKYELGIYKRKKTCFRPRKRLRKKEKSLLLLLVILLSYYPAAIISSIASKMKFCFSFPFLGFFQTLPALMSLFDLPSGGPSLKSGVYNKYIATEGKPRKASTNTDRLSV